jgi:hypothetical protein
MDLTDIYKQMLYEAINPNFREDDEDSAKVFYTIRQLIGNILTILKTLPETYNISISSRKPRKTKNPKPPPPSPINQINEINKNLNQITQLVHSKQLINVFEEQDHDDMINRLQNTTTAFQKLTQFIQSNNPDINTFNSLYEDTINTFKTFTTAPPEYRQNDPDAIAHKRKLELLKKTLPEIKETLDTIFQSKSEHDQRDLLQKLPIQIEELYNKLKPGFSSHAFKDITQSLKRFHEHSQDMTTWSELKNLYNDFINFGVEKGIFDKHPRDTERYLQDDEYQEKVLRLINQITHVGNAIKQKNINSYYLNDLNELFSKIIAIQKEYNDAAYDQSRYYRYR